MTNLEAGLQHDRRKFLKACAVLAGSAVSSALPDTAHPSIASDQKSSAELVRFGKTDLFVSRLCQGTGFIGWKKSPEKALRRGLELGVNFFDSSNFYNWGGAEEVLGNVIANHPRDKLVICTKLWPGQKSTRISAKPDEYKPMSVTREFAFRELNGSLKRLGVEYVDLYMLHFQDASIPLDELADTMSALVNSGKTRYWGVSNHMAWQVKELAIVSNSTERHKIAGTQDQYNITARPNEQKLSQVLQSEGLGQMAYSPLASGILVPGRNAAPGTPAADLLSALDAVANTLSATRSQIATAWVLAQPQVTSVVSGGSRPEHVEDSFAGSNLVLPIDALEVLNSASDIYAERVRESGKQLINVKKCSRYRDRAKESGEQEVWEESCSWQMEQLRQAP